MSHNSKNARNLERARGFTALHKSGGKGPAKTTPKHTKRVTYRTNPETQKRLAEQLKATRAVEERTSGKKILEGAGGASKD